MSPSQSSAEILRDRETDDTRPAFADLATAAAPSLTSRIAQTERDLEGARVARERAGQAEVEALRRRRESLAPVIEQTREKISQPMAAPPDPVSLPEPPTRGLRAFLAPSPGEDPVNTISKLVQGITLMATGFTGLARGDATAALASMKGALAGWQEGDKQRADRHFADWKAKTDKLIEEQNDKHRQWRAILDDKRLSIDQQMQMFKLALEGSGLELAEVQAATKNADERSTWFTQRQNHLDALEAQATRLKQMHDDKVSRDAATMEYRNAMLTLKQREIALKEKELEGAGSEFDADVAARRLIRGDAPSSIVRGIGKIATARFNQASHRAAEILRAQGMSDEQVALVLSRARMSMQANTNALGTITRQEAQIAPFTETARDSLRRAKDLSAKIDRSGTPVLNRWILSGRKQVQGDPDVAAFDYHLRLGINEVAKITSSATGGGGVVSDTARREIEETINRAMTHQQVVSVIDGAEFEMASRLKHIARQKDALLGGDAAIGGPSGTMMLRRKRADGAWQTVEGPEGPVPEGWERVYGR